jgi:hypothetical protein
MIFSMTQNSDARMFLIMPSLPLDVGDVKLNILGRAL